MMTFEIEQIFVYPAHKFKEDTSNI